MGLAGIFLPLLVFTGKAIAERSFQLEFSISDYYDNSTGGDILVGVLFALSFFLFAYKGPEPVDNTIADIGSVMAMGVALFPTTAKGWVHYAHFVFAIGLFTVFIIFSIYLFRKTKKNKTPTREKMQRNKLYLACGWIMIGCIAALTVSMFFFEAACEKYSLVFWGEAIALTAFGISWLTKAEWLYLVDHDEKQDV
jgi:ABC-type Fe3+-siderophore transport system permease subunit